MKIYCEATGRPARAILGRADAEPVFKCFPPGGRKNRDANAVKFRTIEEAADWLRRTAGGGIRVAAIGTATGQGSAILNKGLVIEHSDGRKERL